MNDDQVREYMETDDFYHFAPHHIKEGFIKSLPNSFEKEDLHQMFCDYCNAIRHNNG